MPSSLMIKINDLLKAGKTVYKNQQGFYFEMADESKDKETIAKAGLNFVAVESLPTDAIKITTLKIGLWDRYGGSMPSGWVRWILEQHHFDFKLLYAKEINAGNLKDKFDAIVFVDGVLPIGGYINVRKAIVVVIPGGCSQPIIRLG